jgi:hypothetical protein
MGLPISGHIATAGDANARYGDFMIPEGYCFGCFSFACGGKTLADFLRA